MATLDHVLYGAMAAPPDLGGGAFLVAMALARWAILLGPAMLVGLWLAGGAEERRAAVAATLAGLLAVGFAAVLSSIVFEPRPFVEGLARNVLDHADDSGFPSDHATALFALSFALCLRPPPLVPQLWLPALALALGVGWARVFLGVHFPVDIAAGAVVAGVAAFPVSSRWGRPLVDHGTDLLERAADRVLAVVGPKPRG